MDPSLILNNFGSTVTAVLGILGLARPTIAATFTSIQPVGLSGISEIRATYGGFFFALGSYGLYAQAANVFFTIGIAWLGAAMGRLMLVVIDRSHTSKNVGAIFFELAIGILLLVP